MCGRKDQQKLSNSVKLVNGTSIVLAVPSRVVAEMTISRGDPPGGSNTTAHSSTVPSPSVVL